jgi:hypothetical protein
MPADGRDTRSRLADVSPEQQEIDHHFDRLDAVAMLRHAHSVIGDHRIGVHVGVGGRSKFGFGDSRETFEKRPLLFTAKRRIGLEAAGMWRGESMKVREDVGRHNALDKLAGCLLRDGADTSQGTVVITSRVSVEMVQKTAAIGTPILIAVSAPTALAVRTAAEAGLTLVAMARGQSYQVFTHHRRIRQGAGR